MSRLLQLLLMGVVLLLGIIPAGRARADAAGYATGFRWTLWNGSAGDWNYAVSGLTGSEPVASDSSTDAWSIVDLANNGKHTVTTPATRWQYLYSPAGNVLTTSSPLSLSYSSSLGAPIRGYWDGSDEGIYKDGSYDGLGVGRPILTTQVDHWLWIGFIAPATGIYTYTLQANSGSTTVNALVALASTGAVVDESSGAQQAYLTGQANLQAGDRLCFHTDGGFTTFSLLTVTSGGTESADSPGTARGKKLARTLSTGDTEIAVGVDSLDQLVIYKLINPAAKWNWTSMPSVIPLPTQAAINGSTSYVPVTWRFRRASRPEKDAVGDGVSVTLTFTCRQLPELSIESVWWAASPRLPGPVQHAFRIINSTASAVSLSKPYLDLTMQPRSGRGASLWTFGDQIGVVEKHALVNGFHIAIKSNMGNMGQPMPFALVDDSSVGGLYLGMEEQKDFMITVNTLKATSVRARARYFTQENLRVAAGSTAATPPTYLGVYLGDMEDGSNRFKRWFWNNKTPANHRNDPTAPWTVFGGNWAYNNAPEVWWSEEATYRKGVEQEGLAGIGFEAVEVDAYWDRAEAQGYWPSGTKIMGPLAHANGLRFNLYLMNNVTWNTRNYLKTIWDEYNIDMWRNDFQITDLDVQAWAQDNCPSNYRFNMSPSSSDFKSMTYASQIDLYLDDPAGTRRCFYNLSYVIPPAQICQLIHIPYALGSTDKFKYYFRGTLLSGTWMAVLALGPTYNPQNVALPSDFPELIPYIKADLALYKSVIRPLIREGDLYHGIVDSASGFDGAEYYRPSRDNGVVLLFGPAGSSTTVHFKKLRPDREYRVKFTDQPSQNTIRTGAQLMGEGLPVTFTGTIRSEIILINGVLRH